MSMKFTGLETLQKQLKQLENIGDQIVAKALRAGAEVLRQEIIKRAPRHTGNLIEKIIVSKVVEGHIDIGPEVKGAFYARFLEYGTSKMPAKPFIEPAFLVVKDKIQAVMAEVVQQELKRL
ncbi:HK97-gp10 family putative phage morphogenesis protein [Priestia flexa]|uniref:HK97-gp10 family putative phage morphogenesis protein n=1 Tax=Priestia flexa TaxID=86664 RepID=UPI001F4CBB1D|nr:HK97-gp10 family putative phage morphogenesis protein [Priestia flexa]